MSYPIINSHCNDFALIVKSEIQKNEQLQTGVSFTYPAFSFVQEENDDTKLRVSCSVSLCLKPNLNLN